MMRVLRTAGSFFFQFVLVFSACLIVAQPILAERPPDGHARPPIHVKGNAMSAPTGLSPYQVRHAYGFDQILNRGAGQKIAIVDAFDDPNIASDLATFKSQFGMQPTDCNFQKIYASGSKPKTDAGWSLEIALDVEWACAIAPEAKIILVEAASNSYVNLFQAVDVAVAQGASAISMSWGGGESSSEVSYDGHFVQPNVIFTASSGDSGYGIEYPAASPYVLAVGGTTLALGSNASYSSERAWSGSGGGISAYEPRPTWQSAANPVNSRGVPDVAYNGDPASGFSVYSTVRLQGQMGWFKVGGTSAGAPQWAAFIAIVNSGRTTPLSGPAAIYSAWAPSSPNFHDITSGTNGSCGALCTAGPGYDYVTGMGSPSVVSLYNALIAQ
jgi:subtilase family serine protease